MCQKNLVSFVDTSADFSEFRQCVMGEKGEFCRCILGEKGEFFLCMSGKKACFTDVCQEKKMSFVDCKERKREQSFKIFLSVEIFHIGKKK